MSSRISTLSRSIQSGEFLSIGFEFSILASRADRLSSGIEGSVLNAL
jgi:hypothetical protein